MSYAEIHRISKGPLSLQHWGIPLPNDKKKTVFSARARSCSSYDSCRFKYLASMIHNVIHPKWNWKENIIRYSSCHTKRSWIGFSTNPMLSSVLPVTVHLPSRWSDTTSVPSGVAKLPTLLTLELGVFSGTAERDEIILSVARLTIDLVWWFQCVNIHAYCIIC